MILNVFFLIGKSRRAVVRIDDAAISEAARADDILHDDIIGMGVDAQIGYLRKAPADTHSADTFDAPV